MDADERRRSDVGARGSMMGGCAVEVLSSRVERRESMESRRREDGVVVSRFMSRLRLGFQLGLRFNVRLLDVLRLRSLVVSDGARCGAIVFGDKERSLAPDEPSSSSYMMSLW